MGLIASRPVRQHGVIIFELKSNSDHIEFELKLNVTIQTQRMKGWRI